MISCSRPTLILAASLLAAIIPACSNGGGGGGSAKGGFRVTACTLGCSSRGTCSQNQVALNQEIKLRFNDDVDPVTVDRFSFSVINKLTGLEPTAVYAVSGKDVIFRPQITFDSSGNPIFGLQAGETYIMTVYSTSSQTQGALIRSTGGKANNLEIRCEITASQGVNDPIPGAPSVTAFLQQDPVNNPAQLVPLVNSTPPIGDVKLGTNVVLEFDDLMNPATLVNPVTRTSGFLTLLVDLDSNLRTTIDQKEIPARFSISLDQITLKTTVVIDPIPQLPGPGSNPGNPRLMMVRFLPGIKDLAGNSLSNSEALIFTTEPGSGQQFRISEDFSSSTFENIEYTSALWSPGSISALMEGPGGGSGLHGELAPTQAGVVTFDTDNHTFPANVTLTGQAETVTDGVFYFSRIDVPSNVTVQFTGSKVAQIYAANANIRGKILVGGEDAPLHYSLNDPCPVQSSRPWVSNDTGRGGDGGAGGPAGGTGGSGGDDPRPEAPPGRPNGGMPANPGSTRLAPEHLDGEDGQGIGGIGGLTNGGGGGSDMFPATSITLDNATRVANIVLLAIINYSVQKASGAGGGSNADQGAAGHAAPPQTGPVGPAGDLPPGVDPTVPRGTAVGGAGGGGGGVHCYFSNRISSRLSGCTSRYPTGSRPFAPGTSTEMVEIWNTGCGGGGGGGCGIFQIGRNLTIQGQIDASGGNGGSAATFGSMAPQTESGAGGGGGSGGNIRLEVGGSMNFSGTELLDVRGGAGGRSSVMVHGGDGGAGYVHVRHDPMPNLSGIQGVTAPSSSASVGGYVVSDYDDFSRAESRFYSASGAFFLFEYVDFELTYAVEIPGQYQGDPTDPSQVTFEVLTKNSTWNPFPTAAFSIFFRGAEEDPQNPGVAKPGTETGWVSSPDQLTSDKNLVKYVIVFNRSAAAAQGIVGITNLDIIIIPD